MDINCIICSDLFTPSSDMVMNQCGHVFHSACLLQWMERSKTCPQCRSRAVEKTIHKVYFNYINTDHITDNIGTLQNKLDSANFKVQVKEKELKRLQEQSEEKDNVNLKLRQLVAQVEGDNGALKSKLVNIRSQLDNYKDRARQVDKLEHELKVLRTQLRDLENVKAVITGTRNEVTEILRNETNMESLALLSATLKKSLLDAERKYSVVQTQLKHTQNDVMKYKKKCSVLESTCTELRNELENGKRSWEEEKEYLRNKIEEMSKISDSIDTSVQRIMTESPAPLPRRRVCIKDSPTVAEKVDDILDSDSPYLSVKSNYTSMLDAKYSLKLAKTKSIFKTQSETIETARRPTNEKTVYTGLGGQVREDSLKFPTRKPQLGLKRPKSSSSVPSNKFRKLAPLGSTKITEFLTVD